MGDNLEGILAKSFLFSGLRKEDLQALLAIARVRRYTTGEVIFSEGEEGHGFFVVAEGMVEIYKLGSDGRKQTIHIFGPGEPFGEVVVFEGRRFPANAEAIRPTEVLYFPRDEFLSSLQKRPDLALRMLGLLSRRLRELAALVENLSLKEVTARLAAHLYYLYQRGGQKVLELQVTKAQLASLLGTVPETLSRALKRLADEALIEVRGRQIIIHDPEGLLQRGG